MRIRTSAALAAFSLASTPAAAQVIIDSTGKAPIVIERDKAAAARGGDGVVVHVGKMAVYTAPLEFNANDLFNDPSPGFYNEPPSSFDPSFPAGQGNGLSITFNLTRLPSAARNASDRVAELTALMLKLNDALSRQCGPVVAVFGASCRQTGMRLHANFQAGFNDRPFASANAGANFDVATPSAAAAGKTK